MIERADRPLRKTNFLRTRPNSSESALGAELFYRKDAQSNMIQLLDTNGAGVVKYKQMRGGTRDRCKHDQY